MGSLVKISSDTCGLLVDVSYSKFFQNVKVNIAIIDDYATFNIS